MALVLDGIYPVDVWVTALAWEEFRILFYRNCSKTKQFEILRYNSLNKTSDYIIIDDGVRMILECKIPDLSTPDAYEMFAPHITGTETILRY